MTVDVGEEEQRRAGPYFVSLLRDLGFRAQLRVIPPDADYFEEIRRPGSRRQMGVLFWAADYMRASTMLAPMFACTARGKAGALNVSQGCTPGLTAAIDGRIRPPRPDAPAAWVAVDRHVVDLSAAVPTSTPA